MRIKLYWLGLFLTLTIAAFFYYRAFQPVVSYAFVESFDGNDYKQAYDFFQGQVAEYHVPPPFHQRVLIPLLASLFNDDLITNFQFINFLFSLLSVAMIFLLWRKLGLEFKWIMFGFIWLIFHWTGMIRLNAFDPITVDVALYLFHALFLYLLLTRKFIHLIWLAPLATSQKESFMGYMIFLLIYAWWHNRKAQDSYFNLNPILLACTLSILTKLLIGEFFPASEPGRGVLVTIAYHAKEIIINPFELLRWLAAISMAFGPLLWLGLKNYSQIRIWDVKRNLLLLFSLLSLAYALLAGGDMTRIAFLGFPFIMSWTLLEVQRIDYPAYYLLALLSIPFLMLQEHIPDPGFQLRLWEQWYPEFASPLTVAVILVYTLLALTILHLSSQRAKKRA